MRDARRRDRSHPITCHASWFTIHPAYHPATIQSTRIPRAAAVIHLRLVRRVMRQRPAPPPPPPAVAATRTHSDMSATSIGYAQRPSVPGPPWPAGLAGAGVLMALACFLLLLLPLRLDRHPPSNTFDLAREIPFYAELFRI